MQLVKVSLNLVVLSIAHYLKLLTLLVQVIEDKLALLADGGDPGSHCDLFIEPLLSLTEWVVFLNELGQTVLHMELVGIGVSLRVLLQLSDHLAPVVVVGGGIQLLLDLLLTLALLGPPGSLSLLL